MIVMDGNVHQSDAFDKRCLGYEIMASPIINLLTWLPIGWQHLTDIIYQRGFWLADSLATSQSEGMLENDRPLAEILTTNVVCNAYTWRSANFQRWGFHDCLGSESTWVRCCCEKIPEQFTWWNFVKKIQKQKCVSVSHQFSPRRWRR